ncbi:MAG: hypothetical protein K2H86_07155 [Muribaculaceae bacterium]|nr:hypothetical protein [Muribaculaceae bacterium]
MGTTLQSTLSAIIDKIVQLEESQSRLQRQYAELVRRNEALQLENKDLTQALNQSRLEVEYLRVSYRLAGDADSLIETRRKISSIIRRIDKAIALATDDPSL